jgi:excisionase family DNA binding protein
MSATDVLQSIESSRATDGEIDLSKVERRTLSIAEACALLGIPLSTGHQLAARGEFPCRVIRAGRRYYIPVEAINRLLTEGEAA